MNDLELSEEYKTPRPPAGGNPRVRWAERGPPFGPFAV